MGLGLYFLDSTFSMYLLSIGKFNIYYIDIAFILHWFYLNLQKCQFLVLEVDKPMPKISR